MRHQYTPVFREFTTSSMWAESPATRCVWLWLMLNADPEGCVPGTIPGLAVAANVSLDETRAAVDKFMAPDPDSNTPDHEGRRLEKVPHGWRILNFEYWRELAKHEGEKARKRKWAQKNYKESRQLTLPGFEEASNLDGSSESLDAPIPIPKSRSSSSSSVAGGEPVESRSLVLKELPADMPMPPELEAEARQAGVGDPQRWFNKLKEGPIGGDRGVLAHQLDSYLRRQFGNWRTWEEVERAKDAQRLTAMASPRGFAGAKVPVDPFEPDARQEAFAKKHGLDLGALLNGVLVDYPLACPPLSRRDVLSERLTAAAKQKRAGHPVTGKLTRAELATWGPVPPGGVVPEVA